MEQGLKNRIDELRKVDINSLKREGKDFDFIVVFPFLERIFELLLSMGQSPEFWNLLPENIKNNVRGYITSFQDVVKKIQDFNPNQGNPMNEKNAIITNINSIYSGLSDTVFDKFDVYILNQRLTKTKLTDLYKQVEKTTSYIDKEKNKIEGIVKSAQDASAQSGITSFSGIFADEARKNRLISWWWLGISTFAGVLIVIFLSFAFNSLADSIKTGLDLQIVIQLFFAKIVLLSFFSFIFWQILKNYYVNMHLYTLNKHRENSLKTFESFVKSTDDGGTRDAILKQATKTIFEAGDTGYISSKQISSSNPIGYGIFGK